MSCITGVTHRFLSAAPVVHAHDEHELILICSGRVRLKSSSGEQLLEAPALVSIGHLEKHAVSAEGRYERYVLTLRPEQLPAGSERLPMFFAPQFQVIRVEPVFEPMRQLFELLTREHACGKEPLDGEVWLLQSLLVLLYRNFPECFPCSGSILQTVRAVQAVLEQDLADEISLSRLAGQFHVSVYYLSHSFKRITGYGVLQYRLMARLSLACELLVQTDEPVSLLCQKAGFSDASSFARQFKKSLGCTPGQYRRQHLPETFAERTDHSV